MAETINSPFAGQQSTVAHSNTQSYTLKHTELHTQTHIYTLKQTL